MKQATILAVFITVSHLGFTKPNPAPRFPEKAYADSVSRIPTVDELLSEIMSVTGLQTDFEIKEAKVLNIEACISHKKRYILYNPEFMDWINRATKDKWASIALIAHEIGHHLNGHTIRKGGSKPDVELEADEFAGFVLYKLGASLKQAQEVMIYIAKTEASSTHPARASRMKAIQKGWDRADLSK